VDHSAFVDAGPEGVPTLNVATSTLVLAAAVIVGGCSGSAASLASPAATPAATQEAPDADMTEAPSDEELLTPEPEQADSGPKQYKAGDLIEVTSNDDPWANITVTKAATKKKYGSGYFVDKPAKGNVFIQALVTYKALANGVDYNPFDWQVFVGGEAVDNFTAVSGGPEPQLNSGTLPKGRTAKGWVVYEVPAKGKVVMSYGDNMFSDSGPIFEVVIRAK
jgi:hypothetical protein